MMRYSHGSGRTFSLPPAAVMRNSHIWFPGSQI
nr:MAG TPA: hypothetical protein [Caudoviricetes sp.]